MKRLIIKTLTLFFISAFALQAQSWNTVGSGLTTYPRTAPKTTTLNGEVYAAYSNWHPVPRNYTLKVKKWNGLNWVDLPDTTTSGAYLQGMLGFDGELYVGLRDGLWKFSGSEWTQVDPAGVDFMTVVNNQILLRNGKNLRLYNGTSFTALPQPPSGFWVWDAEYFNGEYHIAGGDSALTNSPIAVLKLTGGNWSSPANYFDSNPINPATWWGSSHIFEYNNLLYFAGDKKLYELNNDTAHYEGQVPSRINDEVEYNGKMWILGDSAHVPLGGIYTFDGNTPTQIVNEPEDIKCGTVANGELYTFSRGSDTYNGAVYNNAYRLQNGFSVLNGTAYLDDNSDCFFNSNENGVSNFMVAMNSNEIFVTDHTGFYSYGVQPGTYSFDTLYSVSSIGKNLSLSCVVPSSLNIGANQTLTQDIGIENTVSTDMQTYITSFTGWRARYGFSQNYQVDVNNAGNATAPSTILTVEVPDSLTVLSVNPAPSSTSGNLYTFNFLNIQPLESREVYFTAKVDTSNNSLGDTLVWNSYLNTVVGDADLSDNTDTLEQTIVGSYDPNDKQASASEILPGTDYIDYHIRFQNTGTDTAYKVTVVDTLDTSLPLTTIIINSASHPYNLSVVDNILIWEFDNIMLPDSGAAYAGSQGFVRFSAGINSSLGVGDTIDNDAEIYFDYQEPVHTNHAKTAIVQNISLPEHEEREITIEVYPNPATKQIHLENRATFPQSLRLFDRTGKLIDEIAVKAGGEAVYPISHLARGLYLLRSEDQTFRVLIR